MTITLVILTQVRKTTTNQTKYFNFLTAKQKPSNKKKVQDFDSYAKEKGLNFNIQYEEEKLKKTDRVYDKDRKNQSYNNYNNQNSNQHQYQQRDYTNNRPQNNQNVNLNQNVEEGNQGGQNQTNERSNNQQSTQERPKNHHHKKNYGNNYNQKKYDKNAQYDNNMFKSHATNKFDNANAYNQQMGGGYQYMNPNYQMYQQIPNEMMQQYNMGYMPMNNMNMVQQQELDQGEMDNNQDSLDQLILKSL